MIPKDLQEVTAADLDLLVSLARQEDRNLDYKAQLPAPNDQGRDSFLADVTAFANTQGGDLIYGIREAKDASGGNTGLPDRIVGLGGANLDAEIGRLENWLQTMARPRVQGVRFKPVAHSSGACLVCRTPRSWGSPHMVGSTGHFYGRKDTGNFRLDVHELRAAFIRGTDLAERLRLFRAERLLRIHSGLTPVPLLHGLRLVVHLLPLQMFEEPMSLDPVRAGLGENILLWPFGATGLDYRPNLDGLVSFTKPHPEGCRAYAQAFRSGACEVVGVRQASDSAAGAPPQTSGVEVQRKFTDQVARTLEYQRQLGVPGPWSCLLSLLGVRGLRFSPPNSNYDPPDHPGIDHDDVLLPDVTIDTTNADLVALLRPLFDVLWQAAGWPQQLP